MAKVFRKGDGVTLTAYGRSQFPMLVKRGNTDGVVVRKPTKPDRVAVRLIGKAYFTTWSTVFWRKRRAGSVPELSKAQ